MSALLQLAIALGLGLLVGLQREKVGDHLAGIRTFPLISLLGALSALLVPFAGAWILGAALLGVAALLVVPNMPTANTPREDMGLTTEVAALVLFCVGVLVVYEELAVAAVSAGTVAALLHWKPTLHRLVQEMEAEELRAVVRLALIGLVVLPVLPNRTYGPYGVLNPFEIWLMVVLIVGISLAAYLAYRVFGGNAGTWMSGLFGGLISSTAVTVAYARNAKRNPQVAASAALAVCIASVVVFSRVMIEIFAAARQHFWSLALPILVAALWMALLVVVQWLFDKGPRAENESPDVPSNLGVAITFGLLYAGILFLAAAVKTHYGERGLFFVAAVSGLTDMDAITLSTAKLVDAGRVTTDAGWRLILTAVASNLIFKGGAVLALGPRAMRWRIVALFGATLVGLAAVAWLWPT